MAFRRVVSIRKSARGAPALPFERIAHCILGTGYELSLVLCGDALAKRVNAAYRKRSYSPNVLSFPLSKKEGEIFLNIRKAEREARIFGTSRRERVALLFVHGCLHLAGHAHGRRMESLEAATLGTFLR